MRLTKEQKIIKFAKKRNFDHKAVEFLSKILKLSDKGIVKDYFTFHYQNIIKKIFNSDNAKFLEVYKRFTQEKFILMQGVNLCISVWNNEYLECLKYNSKRKYSKQNLKDQEVLKICKKWILLLSKKM